MRKQRSLPVRLLIGLWHFVDGVRKVVLNVVFLVLLVLVVMVLMKPDEVLRVQDRTTLVLSPYGEVVDQYSTTPLDRSLQQAAGEISPETRLRDLIEAIERAADDRRITQMLIDTDYLRGIGLSSLHDLEAAITAFKVSGKPVIAMGGIMGQHQYYLASMADEIWLHPDGAVWIDGYANYRQFYREGLDRLEVEMNLFRAGEYKSAAEPFVRDDMSPEARENALVWLGSLWQQYLEGISRHRGIPLESLATALESMADSVVAADGDFARFALELGLVDRLVSDPEARQELAQRGGPNRAGDGYRGIAFDQYLTLTGFAVKSQAAASVSVVVAEGEISSGWHGPGHVGAESTIELLREAGRREDSRAVVFRINSPGGEALASEIIRRELQALRDAGRTVVVSMGDVAASGGYWMAMGADEVWANPSTITGSIGVYGLLPTFGGTLDKLGIHVDGVGTTPLAGKLRLDRPLDEALRRVFQSSTDHVYREFLTRVAEARGMSVEAVQEVARGRVWSGTQAERLGLVDRIGSLKDAIDAAARIAGMGANYRIEWVEPDLTAFERFMLGITSGSYVGPITGLSRPSWPRTGFVQDLVDGLRSIVAANPGFTVAAHCLCGVR